MRWLAISTHEAALVDRCATEPVGYGNCATACELQVRSAARVSSHVSSTPLRRPSWVLPRLAYLTLCRSMQLLALLARRDAAKEL
jgi:hypothetical protein